MKAKLPIISEITNFEPYNSYRHSDDGLRILVVHESENREIPIPRHLFEEWLWRTGRLDYMTYNRYAEDIEVRNGTPDRYWKYTMNSEVLCDLHEFLKS